MAGDNSNDFQDLPEFFRHFNSVPETVIDKRTRKKLLGNVEEKGVVMVHCSHSAPVNHSIRISKGTILFDLNTGQCIPLLHALNIPLSPEWKNIKAGTEINFTLIFAALPQNCTFFDFVEHSSSPSAFAVKTIRRNEQDIYRVTL